MKLYLILFVALISLGLNAQVTRPAEVATDGAIVGASYFNLWGTTSDTLTNTDTATFVLRVKGDVMQDFNIQLGVDHISGTAGGVLIASRSINGVDYTNLDTITLSSVTGDILDTEVINLDNFLYPYLKFELITSGTAVTVPEIWGYTKEN